MSLSAFERMIVEEYQSDAGLVGEEANILCTFHILVTKDFRPELRLHEAIISLTGAGKSTVAEGVIKPFKDKNKEDVIDVVRLTGAALERSESLDGKILLLSQSVGSEPTSMRPLLSEGKLGLMVVERNEGSNKFESKILEVKGMPVFLTTTTDPNLDPELLRRVVQRTVDESATQTKKIKEKQATSTSSIQLRRINFFTFVTAILEKITQENPKNVDQVLVPFAKEIEQKLPDEIEIRSKLPQFLKLVQSVALVKSLCYRGYFQLKAKGVHPMRIVIATLEDFTDALYLAGASFFHLIPATAQAIIDFLSTQVETKEGKLEEYKKCTIRDMQQKLKINNSTIAKYANSLADKGLILKDKTTKGETKVELNLYQYLPNTILDTGLELKSFDFGEWGRQEVTGKGYSLTYSKLENPLEIELFAQKRGMSDSCVNIGQTPTITHESEVYRIETKKTIQPSKVVDSTKDEGYCSNCETSYGSDYREHVQLAHTGKDPSKKESNSAA